MSGSPEQHRKKMEAMREAEHHKEHSTVDGEASRKEHHSHMAHMPMGNSSEMEGK